MPISLRGLKTTGRSGTHLPRRSAFLMRSAKRRRGLNPGASVIRYSWLAKAAFWPWAKPPMRDVGPEEASPPAKTPSRVVRCDSATSMVPRFVSRLPSASQKIDVSSFWPMAAIT